MALLEEVAVYLAAEGLGTFPGSIFIGFEPAEPANTITLYPTGGPKSGPFTDRDQPTMQIRVRNSTYSGGWDVAWTAFKLLDIDFYTNPLQTLKGRCRALQSQPMFLGRGENDEYLFVQNYMWQLIRP